MARFEEFIQKDTDQQAQEAEKISRAARQGLSSINIGTRALKANLQEVAIENPDLARRTRRFLAAARLRRYILVKALDTAKDIHLSGIAPNPAADLAQLETRIRNYAAELQKSATAAERKKLETDLAELGDRALLGGMMQTVREEVSRLKTIQFLEQCIGDTATNATMGSRVLPVTSSKLDRCSRKNFCTMRVFPIPVGPNKSRQGIRSRGG
jgi:hypothetical protein